METTQPPHRPRESRRMRALRFTARVLLALVLLGSATLGVLAIVCTRDPRPHFAERRGVLAAVECTPPEATGNGETIELARLVSTSGLAVELAVRRPAEVARARRPLLVLLGGHQTGRDAVRLVPDTRGTVIAALSYPYAGPRKPRGLDFVRELPRIRGALLDTPPALELALDWLLDEPDVDATRVELVGVSLGAVFACIGGARDERFTRVWSLHGAGRPLSLLEAALERKGHPAPLRWLAARAAYVAACGPHLAPEEWIGSIAPRPVVLVNARDDERLPSEAVRALHDAAGEPAEVVWTSGRHVQPKREEIVRELVDLVLDRVAPETAR